MAARVVVLGRWCGLPRLRHRRRGSGGPTSSESSGDAGFGGDVGDGSAIVFDTLDQAESSSRGQRRITVGHGTGLFQQMDGFSTTHRAGQGPVPSSPLRDYNVMTRNS